MTTKTKAAEPATGPLYVNSLRVENFLRVEAMRIECHGNHVKLSGPNGSGKTTGVSALWWALQGGDSKRWPEPLHKGAEKGSVTIELADADGEVAFVVTRKVTEAGETLVIKAADGSKIKSPQELLKSLISTYCLDPVKFLRLRAIEQCDILISVAGVQPPVDEVQKITGESYPPLPDESAHAYLQRLSGDNNGILYVRRRDIGRSVVEKKAALDEERQALDQLGGPLGADEKEASAGDCHRRIDELLGKQAERTAAQAEAVEARQEHKANADKLVDLNRQQQQLSQTIGEIDRQIRELQKRRQDAVEASTPLQARIDRGNAIIAEMDADATRLEKAAEAMPDFTLDIGQLRQKALEVESGNKGLLKRQFRQESIEKLLADLAAAEKQHGLAENALESVRQLRQHLLDGVELGIPGLEVGIGEIRLGGVPLAQASQAQQITVACTLGMRQNPRLRILTADDGEHLDKGSRETLFRIASENNFEVFFTSVSDANELAIEVFERSQVA